MFAFIDSQRMQPADNFMNSLLFNKGDFTADVVFIKIINR